MDKDPEAIAEAERSFGGDARVSIRRGSFASLGGWDQATGLDGMLFDLGVSSPQLDVAERGFSFGKDGPLDMRMDPESGESAAQWLARADEREIADVLWTYGEERQSRRIARGIVARREAQPLERTAQLADLIGSIVPRGKDKSHPATRSFQAIRIHINRELADLETGLDAALAALKPGGRPGGDLVPFAGRPHRQAVHRPPRQGAAGEPADAGAAGVRAGAGRYRRRRDPRRGGRTGRQPARAQRRAARGREARCGREAGRVSRFLLAIVLLGLVGTGIAVVYARYHHRQLFVELTHGARARRSQHRIRPPAAGAGDLKPASQPHRPGRARAAGDEVPRGRRHRGGAAMNRPSRNRSVFNLRGRMLLVGATPSLCSFALVGRAAYVQLVNADFYQRRGEARFVREIPIPTSRGMITDRNGEPLAVSTPVESVWGNPQELMHHQDRLPELARALGVPQDELIRRLSQRADKEFVYLKRRINPDQAKAILAHNVPGVFSQREFRRFYPQGEAMAHVLGFTNIDDRGREGWSWPSTNGCAASRAASA